MITQNLKPRNYNHEYTHIHTPNALIGARLLKPKLHVSKKKRIIVEFLIPS
jgi:hypothetical protein